MIDFGSVSSSQKAFREEVVADDHIRHHTPISTHLSPDFMLDFYSFNDFKLN
jgi:hypothetical protein